MFFFRKKKLNFWIIKLENWAFDGKFECFSKIRNFPLKFMIFRQNSWFFGCFLSENLRKPCVFFKVKIKFLKNSKNHLKTCFSLKNQSFHWKFDIFLANFHSGKCNFLVEIYRFKKNKNAEFSEIFEGFLVVKFLKVSIFKAFSNLHNTLIVKTSQEQGVDAHFGSGSIDINSWKLGKKFFFKIWLQKVPNCLKFIRKTAKNENCAQSASSNSAHCVWLVQKWAEQIAGLILEEMFFFRFFFWDFSARNVETSIFQNFNQNLSIFPQKNFKNLDKYAFFSVFFFWKKKHVPLALKLLLSDSAARGCSW